MERGGGWAQRSLGLNKLNDGSGRPAKTLLETFRYPRLGPGMMWMPRVPRLKSAAGR